MNTPPPYPPPYGYNQVTLPQADDLNRDVIVNNSGENDIPPHAVEQMGFSWGALLFDWAWCYANRLWPLGILFTIFLIAVNILGFYAARNEATDTTGYMSMAFYMTGGVYLLARCGLAKFGNDLAWRYRHFPGGIDQFRDVQRKWAIAGGIYFGLNVFSGAIVRFTMNTSAFFTNLKPYHSDAGRFTVDMPSTPNVSKLSKTIMTDNGSTQVTGLMYVSEARKDLAYAVIDIKMPPGTINADKNKNLEAVMNAIANNSSNDDSDSSDDDYQDDGTAITDHHYTVTDGHTALDFTAYQQAKDIDLHSRVMIVGNHAYDMFVVCRHGASLNTGRFYNSFKLDSGAGTAQPSMSAPSTAPAAPQPPNFAADTKPAPAPAKSKAEPSKASKSKSDSPLQSDDMPDQPSDAYPSQQDQTAPQSSDYSGDRQSAPPDSQPGQDNSSGNDGTPYGGSTDSGNGYGNNSGDSQTGGQQAPPDNPGYGGPPPQAQ